MRYSFICELCGSEVVYHTDSDNKEIPRWVKCMKRGCAPKVYRDDIKEKKNELSKEEI